MSQTSQYWYGSLQGALCIALPAFGCTATHWAMLWDSWMCHQLCPGGNCSCIGNMGWSFSYPSPGSQQRLVLHRVWSDDLSRQVSSDLSNFKASIPSFGALSHNLQVTLACFTPITASETFPCLWCPVEMLLLPSPIHELSPLCLWDLYVAAEGQLTIFSNLTFLSACWKATFLLVLILAGFSDATGAVWEGTCLLWDWHVFITDLQPN